MNTYNGISISEYRLLAHSILFTVLFVGVLIAVAFWIYTAQSLKDKKEKQRIGKLKEKALNDAMAKKQLEKIERKRKRNRKQNRQSRIWDAVLLSGIICLGIVILGWAVIPGWTDYSVKDYVVYTGEIQVYDQIRGSHIELEDGTTLWGIADFDNDDTYGTVVYSRRTKQVLGGCT